MIVPQLAIAALGKELPYAKVLQFIDLSTYVVLEVGIVLLELGPEFQDRLCGSFVEHDRSVRVCRSAVFRCAFGGGLGVMAVPLMGLVVSPIQAAAILLPIQYATR